MELIEIPQRMGAVRKNAADIKLAVDAVELCFERDYVSTFVIGTGDSDFTPLVLKLRELNKIVIGLGVSGSTSALLPPACDEFLFYDQLAGVDAPVAKRRRGRAAQDGAATDRGGETARPARDPAVLDRLVVQTLSGMERSATRPAPVVHPEARHPAQGPDLQRGRVRLPGLRRAAPQPRPAGHRPARPEHLHRRPGGAAARPGER